MWLGSVDVIMWQTCLVQVLLHRRDHRVIVQGLLLTCWTRRQILARRRVARLNGTQLTVAAINCRAMKCRRTKQSNELNECWNSVIRKLFGYHKWESVSAVLLGLGRLNFKHLVMLRKVKFYWHLYCSTDVFLRDMLINFLWYYQWCKQDLFFKTKTKTKTLTSKFKQDQDQNKHRMFQYQAWPVASRINH